MRSLPATAMGESDDEFTVEEEQEEEGAKEVMDEDEEEEAATNEEEIKPIRLHIDPSASRSRPHPLKSAEGWIVLVTGIHSEAEECDIHDIFAEFGELKNLHMNYDRCTGFTKGYALVEYVDYTAACNAISRINGATLFSQILNVDWAFSKFPIGDYIGRSRRMVSRRRSPMRKY